jgi:hypothetical protein
VNILARVISFILHPLLMATYLFGLIYLFLPSVLYPISQGNQRQLLIMICMMTFVLPALGISVLRTVGAISSFTMPTRRERIRPFFLIMIVYLFFTYFIAYKAGASIDDTLLKFLLVIDVLVIAATAITFYYKVSVHSIGIMGLVGILLPLNRAAEHNALFFPTLGLILLAGVVMSARLQLNSHTAREVWIGAGTGFLIGLLGMIILF